VKKNTKNEKNGKPKDAHKSITSLTDALSANRVKMARLSLDAKKLRLYAERVRAGSINGDLSAIERDAKSIEDLLSLTRAKQHRLASATILAQHQRHMPPGLSYIDQAKGEIAPSEVVPGKVDPGDIDPID